MGMKPLLAASATRSLVLVGTLGCVPSGSGDDELGETGTGSDSDTGADSSTTSDSDTTSDSESGSDSGSETSPPPDLPDDSCADGVPAREAADLCFSSAHVDDLPASGVAVLDFDDDGQADLAFTGSQGTFVLLGNGDGTFDAAIDLDVPGEGTAIAGFQASNTLLVTTTQPDAVVVVTADSEVSYPAGSNPVAFTGALLDGDDELDLVTANAGDGTLGRYLVMADATLIPEPPLFVGGSPSSVSWTNEAFDQDPAWNLAVLDRANTSLLLVQLLGPEPGVVASFPLDGGPSGVWAGTFGDTGTGRVFVGAREASELRLFSVVNGLELDAAAAWPGGPVAWDCFPIPDLICPIAVVLRDAGEVGFSNFCPGEGCSFAPPESRFPVGPDPSSLVPGQLDGDGQRDLVVGSPTHGVTVLLSNP
jgi:hypothetical protein